VKIVKPPSQSTNLVRVPNQNRNLAAFRASTAAFHPRSFRQTTQTKALFIELWKDKDEARKCVFCDMQLRDQTTQY
jgi:hypothetical protein